MLAPDCVIDSRSLTKHYQTFRKKAGLKGSLHAFLRRNYESVTALSDFSLQVSPGEILGLLGPNGAGKTTFMKLCTGIMVPTSGSVKVLGFEPAGRDYHLRRRIALVMGQKSQLWWDIPASDSFSLIGRYYEIREKELNARVAELAERLNVSSLLGMQVRRLSLGERMKMELMASLLHRPEVLFLDEPTIGLDVLSQESIREFLREYRAKQRCTIVLTSHYMADVEALCERVVLIFGGQKRFDGTSEQFSRVLGSEKIVVFRFSAPVDRTHDVWVALQPRWNEEGTQVELRIPELEVRRISTRVLQEFPVTDFFTERLPVERVMAELLRNPELLQGREDKALHGYEEGA